jgi:hypothetical protein
VQLAHAILKVVPAEVSMSGNDGNPKQFAQIEEKSVTLPVFAVASSVAVIAKK